MSTKSALALALLMTTIGAAAQTAPLHVGDAWPSLLINDQFDKSFVVDDQAELVLFSASMAATKQVTAALLATESTCYDSASIRYIADISGMPSFIASTMALPKMRRRPFQIGLIRREEDGAMIPRNDELVTLLTLAQGVVQEIELAEEGAAVAAALTKVCQPPL